MNRTGLVPAESPVSVVIPTWNRRQFLPQAVDSALSQTLPPREIIVVDDGSTDGTGELVKARYGDRVAYVCQSNQGVAAARNLGARLATGKYLAFLDSDDGWLPEKLERQVVALESRRGDHACAVCSSGLLMDRDGNVTSRRPQMRLVGLQNYGLERFLRDSIIIAPPTNLLIRKACFDKVGGFDPTFRFGEDWDLVIRLRAEWSFLYVDTPLLKYRVHSTPTQSPGDLPTIRKVVGDHLRVIRKSAHLIADPVRRARVVRQAESHRYRLAAQRCFRIADWEAGLDFLLRAGRLDSSGEAVPLTLARAVGYWGARSAIEKAGLSCEGMCRHFEVEFLGNTLPRIPERIPMSDDLLREAWGAFFLGLAEGLGFRQHHRLVRAFYQKAFSRQPRYLLSTETLARYAATLIWTSPRRSGR